MLRIIHRRYSYKINLPYLSIMLPFHYIELEKNLSIDVSVHLGSFFAVIVYFYKDIKEFFNDRIIFYKIIVSSLPVMFAGFFLVESGLIDKIRNIEIIR